mgnify:CR=1 FL=1
MVPKWTNLVDFGKLCWFGEQWSLGSSAWLLWPPFVIMGGVWDPNFWGPNPKFLSRDLLVSFNFCFNFSVRSSREQKQLLLESGEQLGVYIICSASVAAVFFMVSLIILTAYMCRKSKRKSMNSGLQQKAPSEGIYFIFCLWFLFLFLSASKYSSRF